MAEPPEDAGAPVPGTAPQPRLHPRPHPDPQQQAPAVNAAALAVLAEAVRALAGAATPEAETEGDPGRTTQKNHRFQRAPGAEKVSAPAPNLERDPQAESAPLPPRRTAPAKARSSRSIGRIDALRKHPLLVWVVVQAFCGGLLLLGVFLGATQFGPARTPVSTSVQRAGPVAAPTEPDGTAEHTLQAAGTALAQETAGDLSSARSALESLAASPQSPPGTEYQLALLALRRGDRTDADLHLARSIGGHQAIAPCCYLRAAFAGERGDYREASTQLQLAAEAEPFAGRYLFYWGEALRRNGKLQDAAACLRQALARPATEDERALYDFKLRLAQAEAGRGDPFSLELEAKLLEPMPSGDWLLLAAAQSVQHNAFPAAAAFLQRAARVLPPETYRTWVSDYAFQNYAGEPELAPYLQQPSPAPVNSSNSSPAPAVVVPPDPTVCTPAIADPALWHAAVPPA